MLESVLLLSHFYFFKHLSRALGFLPNTIPLPIIKRSFMRSSRFIHIPCGGPTVRVTEYPESLIRFTMSSWCMCMMLVELTARMRSPTCRRPQRTAGLPSEIRPIVGDREGEMWMIGRVKGKGELGVVKSGRCKIEGTILFEVDQICKMLEQHEL